MRRRLQHVPMCGPTRAVRSRSATTRDCVLVNIRDGVLLARVR
jgi:hypothetical protein